jgi:hypothetical protein
MAGVRSPEGQVLRIVRESRVPLDDDQIAQAAQMNRVYVNMICRQLAAEGVLIRWQRAAGKLVNAPAGHEQPEGPGLSADPQKTPATCGDLRRHRDQ